MLVYISNKLSGPLKKKEMINNSKVPRGFLRNFGKFRGKHLCQSLFFNKFSGQRQKNQSKKLIFLFTFPYHNLA